MTTENAGEVRLPRASRSPLLAVGRRIGFAVSLVLFVAIVVRLGRDGYVDDSGEVIGFLDALYYASVTVTTTGYGDITAVSDGARLATIALITPARIVFLILVVGTTVEVLTDRSRELLLIRRWRRRVRDHYVICGFGSTGAAAAADLVRRGVAKEEIVVVDIDAAVVEAATEQGFVAIHGDVTNNAVLNQAAIPEAKAVVVAPNRDDTAVLTTLTVRELTTEAHVVAGGREQENLHLLEQAGADEVIDATAAVGRMLGIATRSPAAIGVLDELLQAGTGIELTEVECAGDETPAVPDGASLVAVIRDGRHVRPDDAGAPRPGDRLVVLNDRNYDAGS
ncbi:MAG: potassium channel family protein [Actinomycetota bacterium]